MKMSLTPIIYDFKRSFLRLSTIAFLLVFLLGGVGISYLSYQFFTQQYPSIYTAGIITVTNNTCMIHGIVYDPFGHLVDNARLILVNKSGSIIASLRVKGNYTANITDLCSRIGDPRKLWYYLGAIRVESSIGNETMSIFARNMVNESWYMMYGQGFAGGGIVAEQIPSTPPPKPGEISKYEFEASIPNVWASLILLDKKTGDSVLIILAVNNNWSLPGLKPHYEISYAFLKTTIRQGIFGISGGYSSANLSRLEYRDLGYIDKYVSMYRIRVDPDKDNLVLRIYDPVSNSTSYMTIDYAFKMPVKAVYTGILVTGTPMNLFMTFFPILFLYLSYALLAKPKSIGALEFILARPVTRWDIYLTRWVGGVLTALISPALFVLAVDATTYAILGYGMPGSVLLAVYTGMTLALIAFYSLTYMFAAGLRSSLHLAASITAYLLFVIFWSIIVLIVAFMVGAGFAGTASISYLLAYFNPLGAYSFAQYSIQVDYGLTHPVETANPWLGGLSAIIWITATFIIGYYLFKKANLTS